MTKVLAASPELAAARAAWEDPYCDDPAKWEGLAKLITAAPLGTVITGSYMPELTVAEHSHPDGDSPHAWARLTGDGLPAAPGEWCTCQPPPENWVYYETWQATEGRVTHGWVHADPACRRLVQSG